MTKIAKTDTLFMAKMAETPYPLRLLPSKINVTTIASFCPGTVVPRQKILSLIALRH